MKRMPVFLVIAAAILVFSTSCSDQPSPTAPVVEMEPSLSIFDNPSTNRISQLIEALYPRPFLFIGARVRWHAIQWSVRRGRTAQAQRQARRFANLAVLYTGWGILLDPDDPDLPDTTEEAVSELITRLFAYVGLSGSEAQQEFPDFFEEVFGEGETAVGVIEPGAEEETVIITENLYAAVVAPPDAVGEGEEPVYVAINQLDQAACQEASSLTQAMGCWNITRSPEGVFEDDVEVQICVADNPDMTDEEWNLLLVHRKDDQGNETALPWTDPEELVCEGFGEEGQQFASSSPAESVWKSVGNRVASLLLPQPLGASLQNGGRPPRGLGGLGGAFSDFFGAVPEGALPNLTNWWPGDGNYLDWYGGQGEPSGGVSFTSGVSNQAFEFHGDEEVVVFESIPDRLSTAQELTVATWVNLHPSGPADNIQRFVSMGHSKAVLRQEGGGGSPNRMLHFYMNFGPAQGPDDLRHIWVDNAFQTGCYHFFVGTYGEDDHMRTYLDGVEVGQTEVPGGVVVPEAGWAEVGNGGPEGMNGALDEVMFFDRALTQTEIQEIYDAGGGMKCVPEPGTISGTVSVDGQGLSGATVMLSKDPSPVWTTATDGNGFYEFPDLGPGTYTVEVTDDPPSPYEGFEPSSQEVTIYPQSGVITIDFAAAGGSPDVVIDNVILSNNNMLIGQAPAAQFAFDAWNYTGSAISAGHYDFQNQDFDAVIAQSFLSQDQDGIYEVLGYAAPVSCDESTPYLLPSGPCIDHRFLNFNAVGTFDGGPATARIELQHWYGEDPEISRTTLATYELPVMLHDPSYTVVASGFAYSGGDEVTVDGVLSPGEWDNAGVLHFAVGNETAKVYFKNNGQNLYVAFEGATGYTAQNANQLHLHFDSDGNSELNTGDDYVATYLGSNGARDSHMTCPTSGRCTATTAEESRDVSMSGTFDPPYTHATIELSHPLNSGDDYDISVTMGDDLPLSLYLDSCGGLGPWFDYPLGQRCNIDVGSHAFFILRLAENL